ncbi:hypothetical protein ACB092_06G100000 [Castanea dentata]
MNILILLGGGEEATVVDRISNLPMSLICHILSFLTTKKDAVTSILSSRWNTFWTIVPKLDLYKYEFEKMSSWSSDSGEQIPNQQEDQWNGHFNKIHSIYYILIFFFCNAIDNSFIIPKMFFIKCRAKTNSKNRIDLIIDRASTFWSERPSSSIISIVLKLGGCIVLDPPSSSLGFPSLKVLHRRSVKYANHDSL